MGQPNLDLSGVIAEVERAKGIQASAVALINGIGAKIAAAVTAALQADDAADQGSVDAAVAAVNEVVAGLKSSSDELGAAVAANSDQPPAPAPPTP